MSSPSPICVGNYVAKCIPAPQSNLATATDFQPWTPGLNFSASWSRSIW